MRTIWPRLRFCIWRDSRDEAIQHAEKIDLVGAAEIAHVQLFAVDRHIDAGIEHGEHDRSGRRFDGFDRAGHAAFVGHVAGEGQDLAGQSGSFLDDAVDRILLRAVTATV